MENIIKLIFIAVFCTISTLILKQYKQEYAVFSELAGVCIVIIYAMNIAQNTLSNLKSILDFSDIGEETVELLIKVLGIAVLTGLSSDICKDSSNTALASSVELLGKIMIIVISIPLIKSVAGVAMSLIGR